MHIYKPLYLYILKRFPENIGAAPFLCPGSCIAAANVLQFHTEEKMLLIYKE